MTSNWLKMTAADLGRGIAAGQIDPVALTETYLAAIAAHPASPRIYARLTESRARAEAEAAAKRAQNGLLRGPLDGVPISWKDLFDTAGTATEAGSALLKGRLPSEDAEVLRNATAQGLVCLGKTHMTELAFSGLGLNPSTATPPNVNDPALVPGGSSSGAAVSVGLGLAAAGIGSDTGGSVRIPSAWNDLVGLKTTAGRLTLKGVVPLAESFDTVGPLCRSVEDAALLLGALEGSRAPDLHGATLTGKRLLVLETLALDQVRPTPLAAFEGAVDRLARAGAQVTRSAMPVVAEALIAGAPLVTAEAYGTWATTIEAAPDKMYRPILDRFRSGADLKAHEFVSAWQLLRRLRTQWVAATAEYDAVLLPSSAILPPNAARLLSDAAYFATENLLALRNTRIGNLLGVASLTLPTGTPSCGIMFMAPPMGEAALLRLGAAAESALNG